MITTLEQLVKFIESAGDEYISDLRMEDYFDMSSIDPETAMTIMLEHIVNAVKEKYQSLTTGEVDSIPAGKSLLYPEQDEIPYLSSDERKRIFESEA